mgnify:CR=1 FL=1
MKNKERESVRHTKCKTAKINKNKTTNYRISKQEYERECKEYDAGTLKVSHDLYLGERL